MSFSTYKSGKEISTDDKVFLALELSVVEDFASMRTGKGDILMRSDHLRYLSALHVRGEDEMGLRLLDEVLPNGDEKNNSPDDLALVSELFLLRAEMQAASNLFAEAESSLHHAARASSSPEMISDIALRHARFLVGRFRRADALVVLQDAFDSLPPDSIPTELVTTFANELAGAGDFEHAERLLRGHIRRLTEPEFPEQSGESALCHLLLVSLLLERGQHSDAASMLHLVTKSKFPFPQQIVALASYYSAVCASVSSGDLLSDSLREAAAVARFSTSGLPGPHLSAFEWIGSTLSDTDTILTDTGSRMATDPAYLAAIFSTEEIRIQGYAYDHLSEADYAGAVDAFQKLDRWRKDAGRQGTLIAALDSKALVFALVRLGVSDAVDAARCARQRLQLLVGVSSVITLRAVLDEAQILLDHDLTARAGELARQVLSRQPAASVAAQETLLRLRLVLVEFNTRSGLVEESLNSIESLAAHAAALRSKAPDLGLIVQYQAALALAASGDIDTAEHEFSALHRALDGLAGEDKDPLLGLRAAYGLAQVMQHRGEYTRALSLLRSILDSGLNICRPLSLRVRRAVAECHTNLNDHTVAADVYRTCADDLSDWVGNKDPGYLDVRLSQADCLLASGKYIPARRIYRAIWELLHKEHSGRELFYIRAIMGNGTCLRRLKDYSGAVLNYRRVRNLPHRHEYMSQEETLNLEKWLAWSLEMSNSMDLAAHHYIEAIRLLDELYPERTGLREDLSFRLLCCTA